MSDVILYVLFGIAAILYLFQAQDSRRPDADRIVSAIFFAAFFLAGTIKAAA